MTRFTRTDAGKYMIGGSSYEMLVGTRAQVWHGTAYKTSGGLTKGDLLQNKSGRIVSKAKYNTAKKEKRLVKAGYGTKKGKFGYVKIGKRGGAGYLPSSSSSSSMKGGKHKGTRRHRKQRGGLMALSPSPYDGKGVGTSGVALQFVAGNATS